MPPKVQQSNAKHYKSDTITEIVEYDGPHLMSAQDGWEEIADYALAWAVEKAAVWSAREVPAKRVTAVRITHIGGPTALIELDGWRLLTDPTFDPRSKVRLRLGVFVAQARGPAIAASELPPIDAVLLSHDHHGDNLDEAGKALLPSAGTVVTTRSGAMRLGNGARGLEPWEGTRLEAPGRPTIEITATPCRHGPPLSHPVAGDDRLRAPLGRSSGACSGSQDTVLYDGVREIADRLEVGTALLHLGGVRFPVTGPIRYSMTARDAVELCRLVKPTQRSRSTTRAGSTSSRIGTRSSASSRGLPKTSADASGGCRSASA